MLFGYMSVMGIPLNSVTLAICVMSIGLIVDYCAHIVHHFMITTGSRQDRTAAALGDMGTGVFAGATTTFIGFLPIQVMSRGLTAAIPMGNPYRSCKLTRVRSIQFATFEVGRIFAKMFYGPN